MIRRSIVAGVAIVCMLAAGQAWAGVRSVRTEGERHALIISDEASGPSGALASVLSDQYGFNVVALIGDNARFRNIENALHELAERIGPYDPVFVHISLPVIRKPELFYLPPGANPENPWEYLPWELIQGWMSEVSIGPLLVTYPSCARGDRSAYGDPILEELAYRAGKRRFPVEVMMVCDLESLRTQRRDPEMGFVTWRGEQVSEMLVQLLGGAANSRSADVPGESDGRFDFDRDGRTDIEMLDGANLIRALGGYEDTGLRLSYLTIPLHQPGVFRFVPVETGNAYETRYANARSYDALSETQLDYLGASSESETLRAAFIAFSRNVALSPRAAAPPSLDLAPSEILQLRRNAGWALMLQAEDMTARDAIVEIIQTADSSVMRRTAVVNLSKMGENARPVEIQALKNAVEDPDPFVRDAAVVGLAETRAPETAEFLAAAYQNESDPRVRRSMILMLSSIGREADTPLYRDALDDPDPGVRSQAVAALTALPPSAAINQALLDQLGQEPDPGVRTTIAYALGQTAPDPAREMNIEVLVVGLQSDEVPEVRVAMAKSLGQLGGGDAELALRSTLAGENPASVRIACARALGVLASPGAVPELEAAAGNENPMLRVAAVEALGKIGTRASANVLWMKLEQDEDLRVQQAARKALESMPVDRASIRERLDSPSVQVRQAAVAQVANSDDPAASDLLLEALEDRDSTVQQTSITGLSRRPLTANEDTVRDVLESGDTQTQVNLINVLGSMSREGTPWVRDPLIQSTSSDSPEVRAAAIRALGGSEDPQALELILLASEDPYALVRESAARALGDSTADPATRRLEELAKGDRDENVRRAAVEALSGPLIKKRYRR